MKIIDGGVLLTSIDNMVMPDGSPMFVYKVDITCGQCLATYRPESVDDICEAWLDRNIRPTVLNLGTVCPVCGGRNQTEVARGTG